MEQTTFQARGDSALSVARERLVAPQVPSIAILRRAGAVSGDEVSAHEIVELRQLQQHLSCDVSGKYEACQPQKSFEPELEPVSRTVNIVKPYLPVSIRQPSNESQADS